MYHVLTGEPSPKDLLIHCEQVETSLRNDNQRLVGQLSDAQLDLADAVKSRRELQTRLHQMEAQIGYITQDNEILKVPGDHADVSELELRHAEPQPLRRRFNRW